MQIGVIGVNHKSADLSLRERLARICHRRLSAENSIYRNFSFILLSTCNRIEIYFTSSDLAETHTFLLQIFKKEINEEFEHKIYSYFGRECFFHLACVTAGMDSAIVAETEIQGQVRQAYENAKRFKPLTKELHFLFQKSLKIGKEVRSSLRLIKGLPTLEEAVLSAASHILGDLTQKKILFVGLSEINSKIFFSFKERRFKNITFCNRTIEKLEIWARIEQVDLLPWDELHRCLSFDLTIFGTRSPYFLLEKSKVTTTPSSKRVIIDLSVPRNVDPEISRCAKLINVDELIQVNRRKQLKAAEMARLENHVIEAAVDRQVEIYKLREQQKQNFLYCSVG